MSVEHDQEIEISLDSVEGLSDFSEYLNDQYQEFLADVSDLSDHPEFRSAVQSGIDIYDRLQARLQYHAKQVEHGGDLDAAEVEYIQEDYNQFIRVYEVLSEHTTIGLDTLDESEADISSEYSLMIDRSNELLDICEALQEQFEEADESTFGELAKHASLTKSHLDATITRLENLLHDLESEDAVTSEMKESLSEIETSVKQINRSASSLLGESSPKEKKESVFAAAAKHKELAEDSIVTKRILANGAYKKIITDRFQTPAAFEAALWRLVNRIERPQKLDRVLGVKHGSIFSEVLQGRTVSEVDFFNQQPSEKIREVLLLMEREDKVTYDYRIYVDWMNEFSYMKELIPHDGETLFEDLLAMSELESYRDR